MKISYILWQEESKPRQEQKKEETIGNQAGVNQKGKTLLVHTIWP